jgi:hypothetical protein
MYMQRLIFIWIYGDIRRKQIKLYHTYEILYISEFKVQF